MTKRAIRIDLLVETTLDDDALRNLMGAFTMDLTKDCHGRITAVAVEVPFDDAVKAWAKCGLGEEPAPGATTWTPKRKNLS